MAKEPEEDRPRVGDWVRVWAQVVKTPEMTGVHPEDMQVEFTSHNANYSGDVRLDLIVFKPGKVPPGASRCYDLWDEGNGGLVRCQKPYRHPGYHRAETVYTTHVWDDDQSVGYIEER
jgi:5,10-methenyltetrahydromethanopterin hydrogenase